MNSISFQPIGEPWLLVVLTAVLVGSLFIGPGRGRISGRRKIVLLALRLGIVLMLLLVMLRPAYVFKDIRKQKATLAILVDSSRSLQVPDAIAGQTRWAVLQKTLEKVSPQLKTLAEDFEIHAYTFDKSIAPLQVTQGKLTLPDEPEGKQTALGACLDDVLKQEAANRLLGVLLLTDGAQRAYAPRDLPPQQPAQQLGTLDIPLFAVPFGGRGGDAPDLAIANLRVPEIVFAEMPMQIESELRVRGYGNEPIKVQLLFETSPDTMEVVDTQIVQAELGDDGSAEMPVLFHYTPTTAGEYKVAVRVVPHEGERLETNNELSTFVRVRTGGVKLLLLDGSAFLGGGSQPEQRGVRWALATSPDIALERLHINYQRANRDEEKLFEPGKYDVLLLLNVDYRGLNAKTWKKIAKWVEQGGGLMMAGGAHSFGPGGFLKTPIAELLPVEIGRAERQNFGEPLRKDMHLQGEIPIRPTRAGRRHWLLDLGSSVVEEADAENQPTEKLGGWEWLPPLDGANKFSPIRIKVGATVLAESGDRNKMPLLVASMYGNGRVLAFAGDSTEKWRRYGQGEALKRFWRQVVLWLAKKDQAGDGEVWIQLPQRRLPPGETMTFTAGANSKQNQPLEDVTFTAELEQPDGKRVPLEITQHGTQTLGKLKNASAPGVYRVHVKATLQGKALGQASARFVIEQEDLELDNPAADPELLNTLVHATSNSGGKVIAPEQLSGLLEALAKKKLDYEEEILRKETYWDTWPFFLAFVTLLGTEWYLRKRWGLV